MAWRRGFEDASVKSLATRTDFKLVSTGAERADINFFFLGNGNPCCVFQMMRLRHDPGPVLLNAADSSLAPAVNPLRFQTPVGCKRMDGSYCPAIVMEVLCITTGGCPLS